ncbi:hypothetical protein BSKO_00206 [Bryopsis sp. KO-2023]|nr:hypothetical protein BSKO_00206 [Bryopsis sp. KO-2023]
MILCRCRIEGRYAALFSRMKPQQITNGVREVAGKWSQKTVVRKPMPAVVIFFCGRKSQGGCHGEPRANADSGHCGKDAHVNGAGCCKTSKPDATGRKKNGTIVRDMGICWENERVKINGMLRNEKSSTNATCEK